MNTNRPFIRGAKVMLPPADQLDQFFSFIDIIRHFGYNTLMIELGGAMEYKRHPEINEGWVEYAAFMNEYPGKGQKIQHSFSWDKNSIHSENGGGKFLLQSDIKKIIDYVTARGIEIIPEVPCLSHCDYLLTRHPELVERKEDPYPDTFCPSNPGSYKLLFDLFDEIIELFHPSIINIGHDEYYTIGICDKCKSKSAPQIFADDIKVIHDYLSSRGIRTMMWAEKLLDSHFIDSKGPCGGAERECVHATYPAIDLVPDDLLLLHWYWGIDRKLEGEFIKRGMTFAYGNYCGRSFPEWKRRAAAKGFQGYILSNWGRTDLPTLQRNGVLADIVFNRLVEESPDPDGEHAAIWKTMFRTLFDLRYGDGKNRLFIRHATEAEFEYRYFVDGYYIDEKTYKLGDYEVMLKDGSVITAPVIYGLNISKAKQDWNPPRDYDCDCYPGNPSLAEVAFTTLPVESDGRTEYIFGIDLPDNAEVASVRYIPLKEAKVNFICLISTATDKIFTEI